MRRLKIRKKGQIDIIGFIAVAVSILMVAIIVLKIVNSVTGNFSIAINQTSQEASSRVDYVHTSFVNFWDYLIAIAYLVNIVMLFVFAIMVDAHPIFSLFYLISAVFTLMFAPYVISPIETLFGMDIFSDEISQLTITSFLVSKFGIILLGIIIITGIIMYGKWKKGGAY